MLETEDMIGKLIYVGGEWRKVFKIRIVDDKTEYFTLSYRWWARDEWFSKDDVESVMEDTGQFN